MSLVSTKPGDFPNPAKLGLAADRTAPGFQRNHIGEPLSRLDRRSPFRPIAALAEDCAGASLQSGKALK